jgi:hypothetical protein
MCAGTAHDHERMQAHPESSRAMMLFFETLPSERAQPPPLALSVAASGTGVAVMDVRVWGLLGGGGGDELWR